MRTALAIFVLSALAVGAAGASWSWRTNILRSMAKF